eukprot:746584-Hanusia_phi.AAC.6
MSLRVATGGGEEELASSPVSQGRSEAGRMETSQEGDQKKGTRKGLEEEEEEAAATRLRMLLTILGRPLVGTGPELAGTRTARRRQPGTVTGPGARQLTHRDPDPRH